MSSSNYQLSCIYCLPLSSSKFPGHNAYDLGIVYFILRILYTLVGVTAYFNGFGGQGAEIVPELSDIAARAAGTPGTY